MNCLIPFLTYLLFSIDIPVNHAPPHIEPVQETPFKLLSKEEQKLQQKEEKERIKRAKEEEKRRKKEEEKDRKRIEKERKSDQNMTVTLLQLPTL
jgi:predicted Holliday junction resolvase-like endonuclease